MSGSVRSRASLVLVLAAAGGVAAGSGLAGCSGDRSPTAPPGPPQPASALTTPSAAAPAAAPTGDRPAVQVMADGSLELRPRLNDVSMLERQPDGSYRRRCGRPSDETRTMMEQAMRARRGSK